MKTNNEDFTSAWQRHKAKACSPNTSCHHCLDEANAGVDEIKFTKSRGANRRMRLEFTKLALKEISKKKKLNEPLPVNDAATAFFDKIREKLSFKRR